MNLENGSMISQDIQIRRLILFVITKRLSGNLRNC